MPEIIYNQYNDLFWPDKNIKFNLEELLDIYHNVFSKFSRLYQDDTFESVNPTYRGISFQGLTDDDHITAIRQGSIEIVPETGKRATLDAERLGPHLEKQAKFSVRHKTLCVGEFARILDYLEDLGYHTHRGRIMELSPKNPENWHLDSYEGRWGNNVRFHVPLISNPNCYLQWIRDSVIYSYNPQPDGTAYWLNTDVKHQYLNRGDTWRAHIVIDLIKK